MYNPIIQSAGQLPKGDTLANKACSGINIAESSLRRSKGVQYVRETGSDVGAKYSEHRPHVAMLENPREAFQLEVVSKIQADIFEIAYGLMRAMPVRLRGVVRWMELPCEKFVYINAGPPQPGWIFSQRSNAMKGVIV